MTRLRLPELTERQREALKEIRNFIAHHGISPTVRDLAKALRVTSSTAFYLLGELEQKGCIRRDTQRARSLKPSLPADPTDGRCCGLWRFAAMFERPADADGGLVSIPILGTAAAGLPNLAVEDRQGSLWVEQKVAARGHCFALKIKGDSMIRAGIKDGDMVVARQQPVAQNGDIVVALLGEDSTVKELSIRGDHIELKPRNPSHRSIPIGPEDELRILGKVIAIAAVKEPHGTRSKTWQRTT